MVQSGTELKGTVIVPLISAGTKHTKECCVTEGTGNAEYDSTKREIRDVFPACSVCKTRPSHKETLRSARRRGKKEVTLRSTSLNRSEH